MKKVFVLLLVIGLSLKVYSQNHIKQDTLLQKSFEELSELFYTSKPDTLKATIYAKKYFSKALKEKDTIEMMSGKYYLADILNDDNVYLDFCDSLIDITKKKPTKKFPAIIYLEKGKLLFQKNEVVKSLNEYLNAISSLKKSKNDSLLYLSKMYLGMLKAKINKDDEALKLFKEVYSFALKKNYFKKKSGFYSLLVNIPITYNKLNLIDSAMIYCKKAESIFSINNDSLYTGSLLYVYGMINKKKGNYQKAINLFNRAVPYHISDENSLVLLSNYNFTADCFVKLKRKKSAFKYYSKVDSIQQVEKFFSQKLISCYFFLKDFYKSKGDFKNQLSYLNKIIEVNNISNKKVTDVNNTFINEYDIPNLILEKKQVIEKLENEVQESRRNKIIYISLLVFSLVLISYQINKKRVYKKRFATLMKQNEATKTKEIEKNITQATSKHELSDDTVTTLMEGLEMFETHEVFLNSKINLQLLADRLDTNTSYLSKVINQYKNTSFSNYVNQLRIEYAIEKLKNDTLWRKYTVKAIAQEVGFKNSESFSKAFYKFTGIKPSYFIKELEKTETN
ncbi:MAG: AraC family transcriptional regulator [Tenacibaculum sp.]|uniref:helix-turn-helix domain-containing protein n=1 Tax=Tenacibaculum sp. TaxID=1906242 RepID=UPI00181C6CC8|nr:helix-turn-helix domain-containing protein [Tenacibaculum sp.]NVK08653.1 AraC family transcriptional regulator [Tenacibaculum sp.]